MKKQILKNIISIMILIPLLTSIIFIKTKAADILASNTPYAVVMESVTGEVVFDKNSHERRFPASMTKVMSLKIIFDKYVLGQFKMDDLVTTSEYASSMGGSQIFLSVNEQMKVEDLIKSIIIASANDACVAMAEFISGSEAAFVELMNEEARRLGLQNTHFANATGLPVANHYTSAYDMALMSRTLINTHGDLVLPISSKYDDYVREGTEKQFWLVNTNKLVKFVDGIDGLKTGWTSEAGYCLAATMKKDNIRFIAVAMGCSSPKSRNSDIVEMLNYGVNNYELVNIYQKGDIIEEKEDILLSPHKYHLVVNEDIGYLKKKNEPNKIVKTLINDKKLDIYLDNELYYETELVEQEQLNKANFLDILIELLKQVLG